MTPRDPLLAIFASVFALLAVASAIAALLKARRPDGAAGDATIANLIARIKAWWVMIVCLATAFWCGPLGIALLFAFISLQCLREFLAPNPARHADYRVLAGCFLFLPLQYYLLSVSGHGLFFLLIPVCALLLVPVARATGRHAPGFRENSVRISGALIICIYGLSHVPALLALDIPGYAGRNALLIAFLLLTVQSSDVLQYIWGKLLGKHRISPKISPSKTLEGLVGGILTSTAAAAALWFITPFQPWQAGLIALTVNIMGFAGGLVLSAIKRERGIKDWGNMIGGHGGMLDRVDSICFSAPVFFHIVRYGWVPL